MSAAISGAGPAAARPLGQAIVQQAAIWMARLWSGDASDGDRAACAAWRAAHPDHELAWQRLQVFEDRLHSVPAGVARQVLRDPARPNSASRRRALQALGVLAGAGSLAALASRSGQWQLAVADISTATGEIRAVTLPDGSRVVLASASAIDVRYTPAERLLVLRAGEIMVTTAHGPDAAGRPFRVRTAAGGVLALGTRFTVQQEGRDEYARVAVFEGAVELRPQCAPSLARRIEAGQGAVLSAKRVRDAYPVQESSAAWARGLLVADGMRLDVFLARLSDYRRGVLRCDPAVAGLLVTGVFPLRDTDRALHNLTLALPLAVSRRTRYWVSVHLARVG